MNPDKITNILNIIFLILAAISLVLYFTVVFKVFMYVFGAALFAKLMEFFIRFTYI